MILNVLKVVSSLVAILISANVLKKFSDEIENSSNLERKIQEITQEKQNLVEKIAEVNAEAVKLKQQLLAHSEKMSLFKNKTEGFFYCCYKKNRRFFKFS
jgi:predicted  nucleic acid-binding Zn-ribbon protein